MNLEDVFLNNPASSVRELESVIQDVYQLVQREYPQIDMSLAIDQSLFLRPEHERE
ncbi:hypothetical protein J18TS1_17530 [Oceanobacillus oncorhynchi subsp. incaldanensis]|uniref:Uncharacterized protein n=1 Tax=Oceanobacillus oncorhynchi TaxID=545501 RepID=A0A0A1MQ55_9BACI|nr:hypothetical protein [Oceanobacillus oncorhynchi]GIO18653.1 hypothetical protein J18TS1_17530 [Oceanobacillus oncorhynchi subsp. incaldanensis]CEI81839.1 hypothetical protein BN997_01693 [Oceanobacillus oncorhynchi]